MSASQDSPAPEPRRRRVRYRGTHPRRYSERYKELDPQRWPDLQSHVLAQGRTPAGAHVPVLLNEALDVLRPMPGELVADCTLGHAGHALALLTRVSPGGRVIGFDVDAVQLARAAERVAREHGEPGAASAVCGSENDAAPSTFTARRANFAGIGTALQEMGLPGYDVILADLGVSSMQIDDPTRGFSYKHDGPLDMRMDDRLRHTAADVLAQISEADLSAALWELADEPQHARIARAIKHARERAPITRTGPLSDLVQRVASEHNSQRRKGAVHEGDNVRPRTGMRQRYAAARTFQALRMLVNDERGNLRQLLRIVPYSLNAGGRFAIICFHSGEERLVCAALEKGMADRTYARCSTSAIRAGAQERRDNPRSSAARLWWAQRA